LPVPRGSGAEISKGDEMPTISIVKNKLTDGSLTFDLLIQNNGESVTVGLIDSDESAVNRAVNAFHDSFEKMVGGTVLWGDTLENTDWA